MGDEGSDGTPRGSSPYRSKYQDRSTTRLRNGSNDPGSWRSYSESENQVCSHSLDYYSDKHYSLKDKHTKLLTNITYI
jgi:hypothetical protein